MINNKIRAIIWICLLSLVLLGQVPEVLAQDTGGLVPCKDDCTIQKLIFLIVRIINYLLAWAWLVCILFVVWGGWEMVGSGGDSEKIQAGKDIFSNAIIGFFMTMAAFILINFVVGALIGKPLPQHAGQLDNILEFIGL